MITTDWVASPRRYVHLMEKHLPLADLNQSESEIVRQCLNAAANGPFFSEWEFSTLFGIERSVIRAVLASWPKKIEENSEDVQLAVNGSLVNLLGYPHGCDEDWSRYISVSKRKVEHIYQKLGVGT